MKKRGVLFILALLISLVGICFYWLQSSSGLVTDKFYEVKILSLDKQIAAVCEDYQEKLSQSDFHLLKSKIAGMVSQFEVIEEICHIIVQA